MKFDQLVEIYKDVSVPVKEAVIPKAVELVNRADKTVGSTMNRLGKLLSGKKDDEKKVEVPPPVAAQSAIPPAKLPAPPSPPAPVPPPPAPMAKVAPPATPEPPPAPAIPSAIPTAPAPVAPPAPPAVPPKVSGTTPAIPQPAVPKSAAELKNPEPIKTQDWMVSKTSLIPEIRNVIKSHSDVGRVVVNFRKIDGSLRRIVCTTNMNLIPTEQRPKGLKKPAYGVMPVYDLEKNDWRSFVLQRVINMIPPNGKIVFFNDKGPTG